MHDGLMTCEVN